MHKNLKCSADIPRISKRIEDLKNLSRALNFEVCVLIAPGSTFAENVIFLEIYLFESLGPYLPAPQIHNMKLSYAQTTTI